MMPGHTEDEIVLRNGDTVPSAVLDMVWLTLRQLADSDPAALAELIAVSRDPTHRPFGDTARRLQGLALLEPDGQMQPAVWAIVASAAVGEGAQLRLTPPAARRLQRPSVPPETIPPEK
jgi:hypothetical protein